MKKTLGLLMLVLLLLTGCEAAPQENTLPPEIPAQGKLRCPA